MHLMRRKGKLMSERFVTVVLLGAAVGCLVGSLLEHYDISGSYPVWVVVLQWMLIGMTFAAALTATSRRKDND